MVTVEQTQEMFNLTVDEAHTYYVGTNGWLVHNAGGLPCLTVKPSQKGLDIIGDHFKRPDFETGIPGMSSWPYNDAMVARIKSTLEAGKPLTGADAQFYLHEIYESTLMSKGVPYAQAHAASLGRYGVKEADLYAPEVVKKFAEWFK